MKEFPSAFLLYLYRPTTKHRFLDDTDDFENNINYDYRPNNVYDIIHNTYRLHIYFDRNIVQIRYCVNSPHY